jgi:uncharacterized repeat protein (TIGR02543 family)
MNQRKNMLVAAVLPFILTLSVVLLLPTTSYANSEGVDITFSAEEGGQLIKGSVTSKTIKETVSPGTDLKSIYPKTEADKYYKFDKWEDISEKADPDKIQAATREYKALFFPDYNNNDVDDRTEKVTVRFDSQTPTNVSSVTTQVGEKIELPELSKEGSVFIGWFTESSFENPFNASDRVTDSMTLFAKWQTIEDIIKSKEVMTIRDKDISDTVEVALDEQYNTLLKEKEAAIKKSEDEANQVTDGLTVVKKIFENPNVDCSFLLKFFNENEEFMFSLVVPYGRTIETLNESMTKQEEYGVRQTTTIVLNTASYVSSSNPLDFYEVRNVQSNENYVTQVFPRTKTAVVNESETVTPSENTEEPTGEKKSKLSSFSVDPNFVWYGIYGVVGLIFLVVIGLKVKQIRSKKKSGTNDATENEEE